MQSAFIAFMIAISLPVLFVLLWLVGYCYVFSAGRCPAWVDDENEPCGLCGEKHDH